MGGRGLIHFGMDMCICWPLLPFIIPARDVLATLGVGASSSSMRYRICFSFILFFLLSTYWCVFCFRENSFFTARFLQGFLKNKILQALRFFKTFWFIKKLLLVYSFFTAKFPQELVTCSIETFEDTLVHLEVVACICALRQLWESIWADCWIGHWHLDWVLDW